MMNMKALTMTHPNNSMDKNSLFAVLNLRTQYENIVSYRKTYDLPTYSSDIDSLYYFINHGAKNNRFRKRFNEAMEIAKDIIKSYENEKTNLSGVHGQEEQAVRSLHPVGR
jgi:hypothetical protein